MMKEIAILKSDFLGIWPSTHAGKEQAWQIGKCLWFSDFPEGRQSISGVLNRLFFCNYWFALEYRRVLFGGMFRRRSAYPR